MRFFNSSTMSWILSESHVTRQGTNRDIDNAAHERANNELAVEEGEDTWNQKETANKLQFKACHAKSCRYKYDILIRRKTNLKKIHIATTWTFFVRCRKCRVQKSRSVSLALARQFAVLIQHAVRTQVSRTRDCSCSMQIMAVTITYAVYLQLPNIS